MSRVPPVELGYATRETMPWHRWRPTRAAFVAAAIGLMSGLSRLPAWNWQPSFDSEAFDRLTDYSIRASLAWFPAVAIAGWIACVGLRRGPIGCLVVLGPITVLGLEYVGFIYEPLRERIESCYERLFAPTFSMPACWILMWAGTIAAIGECAWRRRPTRIFAWPLLAGASAALAMLQFIGWSRTFALMKALSR